MLARLPNSYSMLVTALEANANGCGYLQKERKQKDREKDQNDDAVRAMARRPGRCYNCGKPGAEENTFAFRH